MVARTTNPALWELIVIVDTDDASTLSRIPDWRLCYRGTNIVFITRERSRNLSDDYYNWVFGGHSSYTPCGRIFWVIGDDTVFLTDSWDTIARDELRTAMAPDHILYAYPQDVSDNKPPTEIEFGWFPMVTREAVGCLGYFMPPEYITWGADIVIARLYNEVNRVKPLSIRIDHISYHSYIMDKDTTAKSMSDRHNTDEERVLRSSYDKYRMPNDIQKLQEAINGVA